MSAVEVLVQLPGASDAEVRRLARGLAGEGLAVRLDAEPAPADVLVTAGPQLDGAPTVVCVEDADRRAVSALLAAGAGGVVLRADPTADVARAVRMVLSGYVVVPQPARQALRRPVLTTRQKQVLGLVVLGLGNREIAGRLFLSEATVKTHLTAAFSELGVKSRKEAVDAILDPEGGLGRGLLAITEPVRTQPGYGSPVVS